MSDRTFDVLIAGAGPAGLAAALRLASSGRSVCVLERRNPGAGSAAAWLNARAQGILSEIGVATGAILKHPLTTLTFHNADLSKSASPAPKEPLGFLVDRSALTAALAKEAERRGVELCHGFDMTGAELGEETVRLTAANGASRLGRFMIVATGRGTPWLERLNLGKHAAGRGAWLGTATGPRPKEEPPGVHLVLGLDHAGSFVMLVAAPEGVAATMHGYGEKVAARPAFVQVCRLLAQRGHVPPSLPEDAASAPLSYCPTAMALDLETHVGKNVIVVGDAGGFQASLSHEGLYPAMWSAVIAADVLIEASGSKHPQDVLQTFETKWRSAMAAYLAPPNTDTTYLLPMIFSNAAMAERMARAFFAGEGL